MSFLNLSATITAPEPGDGTGTDQSDWLNITQDKIDPRFDSVTSDFLSTLYATVSSGGDPYSLVNHDCPVSRRITTDGVVASYRGEIIVNRSRSLEGLYELSAGQYDITGPRTGFKNKSGQLITDGRKVVELGWLPLSLSVTQEYPLFPQVDWIQDNGYLYLTLAEYYALFLRGTAEVDIWTVHVDHQQGQNFPDSEIAITATWGDDNKVDGTHKIPGCTLDTFNECPKDFFGIGGQDPEQTKWKDMTLNPSPPRKCYQDGCTGETVRCDTMDDER